MDTQSANSRRIVIFDTTLRDGEQSPGASMNLTEKMELAQVLADLKVDVIEAGFPDFLAGRFSRRGGSRPEYSRSDHLRFGPMPRGGHRSGLEALQWAERARIHVFLATSAIHREHKLRMDKEDIIRHAIEGVKRARGYCDNIEFSPEDASRTELDFLCEVVEKVIDAGASTINIPDTVGYATPEHMYHYISTLMNRVPNIDKAVISVHCHNDLGLAVANSLASVMAGAGQVECTINGIGERAGNCSLEEIAMTLRTRHDHYKAHTNIVTQKLVPASRLVSNITGLQVQRNKAIVGQNAFAHEAGIHQDGYLKERTTYEIMRPEDVGFAKTDLVLGKHSGRAALADRIKSLGYSLENDQLDRTFQAFKELADKKKEIYDSDIAALIENQISSFEDSLVLDTYKVICGTGQVPEVTLRLRHGDEKKSITLTTGDGPVDAVFRAIAEVAGVAVTCKDFTVHSVSVGMDAQAEVMVQLQ